MSGMFGTALNPATLIRKQWIAKEYLESDLFFIGRRDKDFEHGYKPHVMEFQALVAILEDTLQFSFTDLTDTPDVLGTPGQILEVNATGDALEFVDPIDDFLDLIDTPTAYTGFADYHVAVNATEDGLEFVEAVDEFIDLIDTPNDYTGSAGYNVVVNGAGTGLEFVPLSSGGGDKYIDSFYANDMIPANGYTWVASNVEATALDTINESIRVQVFAGTGGADGCFASTILPTYYTTGDLINVNLSIITPSTGGDFVLFIGIQRQNGNVAGDETTTTWSAVNATASVVNEVHNISPVPIGIVGNANPGEAIVIKIFREPSEPLDTYTGDLYLNSLGLEIY